MEKKVFWSYNGNKYKGTAALDTDDRYISITGDARGTVFDILREADIKNGMTLEEIFEDIPEDITEYELK